MVCGTRVVLGWGGGGGGVLTCSAISVAIVLFDFHHRLVLHLCSSSTIGARSARSAVRFVKTCILSAAAVDFVAPGTLVVSDSLIVGPARSSRYPRESTILKPSRASLEPSIAILSSRRNLSLFLPPTARELRSARCRSRISQRRPSVPRWRCCL